MYININKDILMVCIYFLYMYICIYVLVVCFVKFSVVYVSLIGKVG